MVQIKHKRLKVEAAIEDRLFQQDLRQFLGGSGLGGECGRATWYGFRWAMLRHITARQKRLFGRGHAEEVIIIEDLMDIGCKIKGAHLDKDIKKRLKTVFGVDFPETKQPQANYGHGHGSGSGDCIIYGLPDAPKTPHLLEAKTAALQYFLTMKEKGLRADNFVHYVQINIYMGILKIKRCLYVMVHKDTDARYYERVKFNPKIFKEYIKRAETIVTAFVPPPRISQDGTYYKCGPKWCDYRPICHGTLPLAKNCRTCCAIVLAEGGIWKCGLTRKALKLKKQKKGCPKYKAILN